MGKKYTATWKVLVTVEFEDDGVNDLGDQGYDAVHDLIGDFDGEQVGDIVEKE